MTLGAATLENATAPEAAELLGGGVAAELLVAALASPPVAALDAPPDDIGAAAAAGNVAAGRAGFASSAGKASLSELAIDSARNPNTGRCHARDGTTSSTPYGDLSSTGESPCGFAANDAALRSVRPGGSPKCVNDRSRSFRVRSVDVISSVAASSNSLAGSGHAHSTPSESASPGAILGSKSSSRGTNRRSFGARRTRVKSHRGGGDQRNWATCCTTRTSPRRDLPKGTESCRKLRGRKEDRTVAAEQTRIIGHAANDATIFGIVNSSMHERIGGDPERALT
jgi:hypothetical protein